MASPSAGSTGPKHVNVVAYKVISITDNIAHVKIGNDYWDIKIIQRDPSHASTTEDLEVDVDLAEQVRSAIVKLADSGALDLPQTSKVTFRAEKTGANVVFKTVHVIDKDAAETTIDCDTVGAKVNAAAISVLQSLGTKLGTAKIYTRPATSTASRATSGTPPGPAAKSPTSSALKRPASTGTRSAAKPFFEQQFKTRTKAPSTSAALALAAAKQSNHIYTSSTPTEAGNIITKTKAYILDTKNAFHTDPSKFAKIKADIDRFRSVDSASLFKIYQALPKEGWSPFAATRNLTDFNQLLDNPGLDADDSRKRLIVRIYAEYIAQATPSATALAPGNVFFEAAAMACADQADSKPIAILEEDPSGKISCALFYNPSNPTQSYDQMILSNCAILFRSADGKYHNYDRAGTPSSNTDPKAGLIDLNAFSSALPKEVTFTFREHVDVGAGGRCADKSLADQILRLWDAEYAASGSGSAPPTTDVARAAFRDTTGKALRDAAADYLESSDFESSSDYHLRLASIVTALQDAEKEIRSEAVTALTDISGVIAATDASALQASMTRFSGISYTPPTSAGITLTTNNLAERLKHEIKELGAGRDGVGDASFADTVIANPTGPAVPASTTSAPTLTNEELITKALANVLKEAQENDFPAFVAKQAEAGISASTSSTDKDRLRNAYAELIRNNEKWTDQPFFYALGQLSAASHASIPTQLRGKEIVIVEDHPTTAGSYKISTRYPAPTPSTTPINPDQAVFIWYDGEGHYHTIERNKAQSEDLLAKLAALPLP